ncbi:wiskott-Aldrich syndrome protein family member 3 [Denticeps clupeoides]|uniref:Wiskott-Aldrich syndrome protein family member n=1 Tax=Denticeps clupeoides TaxID=299321 RepID=A0AAY4BKV5_9TELE|nr:wiskott-Aldrich syndrome protein family member 3 [Denticeps clupeoides]XP_028839085.1 wiskott-Aldrich syndrome protein family member 3 [Denticeps clupeoides]XP_028839087.1 wiskott-Aldrich syndrome protein family member 3 [Denticeps clupeoides]XP_028839088.1 wiskott-Aldrich syndrome protein family member 3 [Denticeps clupeoides]XP_028839089.1 wiskott-Aldrich syndrome protein family member 3 [Denticeps clupeoides]
MPLVKRNIEPRHLCHGPLPQGIGSELECVTNNTLSAIIRQLSSLSKHAEDIFGELFNEANTFYVRANSLQDRIDRLAVKVTQLDSSVEEVSLQDINMRKAFRSGTVQDQQVVSRASMPHPVAEKYNNSDKPPPLSILSAYRDDHSDGMKFYTDPSYFFDLWKEKMLQDTEDKRKEKRRQREQKRCVDGTLPREIKKVRKARNRRQEWNMLAFDKELRPDHRHAHCLHRGASSEGSLSPEPRPHGPDADFPFPGGRAHVISNHGQPHALAGDAHASVPTGELEHEYHSIGGSVTMSMGYRVGTLGRAQPRPPQLPPNGGVNGAIVLPPADYGIMEYYASSGPSPLPPSPVIPSAQTAFATPLGGLGPPVHHIGPLPGATVYPLPPMPPTGPILTPPPPPGPPPAPPVPPVLPHSSILGDVRRPDSQPNTSARSDLLSAIRMGIQLKKVQEQQEQQAKRQPVGYDVATILSRRIAVEYTDSEEDSELEDNEWSD